LGDPAKAVEMYVGAEYIQHNPLVGDGKQAFIDYFTEMVAQYPSKEIEFVRAVAEGDLVALHTHQTWPGNEEYVTMDFFRFDTDGKIIEHWDVIQEVPNETKNGNPMY
jgi:predicted SnoaL-like aldol condensation-catalyzing enzyme